MATVIHPSAIVDEGVQLGEGCPVWEFVHFSAGARIGKLGSFGQNFDVGNELPIGDKCKVHNNDCVCDAVTLEDDVFCVPGMVFTNGYHPRSEVTREDECRRTLVLRGVALGAKATIVCGPTAGRYALVGAGAVVTRDMPDFALTGRVHACQAGWVSRFDERRVLPSSSAEPLETACPQAGDRDRLAGQQLPIVEQS